MRYGFRAGAKAIRYRAFSLTWPASMQIYWNKRKRLQKKRVELPLDWFGTPTWLPFHCFGTPIWPPWSHVKTIHSVNIALRVISIKLLLVISMLCKTEWSWELRTWSNLMNLLDILSTSPHYLCRKWIGATNENLSFNLRVWRVKHHAQNYAGIMAVSNPDWDLQTTPPR